MPQDSPRRWIAKTIATGAVWTATSALIDATVDQVFEIEEDSLQQEAVHFGSSLAGFGVAMKLGRRTDALVDKIADWRHNRKADEAEHPEEVTA